AETRLFEPGLLPALGCAVLAVALPFGLAELSYRFLEAPILMWRPPQDRAIARVSRSDRSLFFLAGAAK
ncbi:MAG: hypothetical protein QOG25_2396, partial [Acetobacteraceae bacterium]|nr:hypothetical protein [Acetobacteraceae bacterium]